MRYYVGTLQHVFPTRKEAVIALSEYEAASDLPAALPVSYSVEPYNRACGLTGFCVFVKRPGWVSGWLSDEGA